MLNQVIYTRCLPRRILTEEGRVSSDDGFGVFAFSEELLDMLGKPELDLLMSYLSVKNAASENADVGVFQSYDYVRLSDDTYGISFEFLRPRNDEPRKNGKTNRIGNFIKQCLVGKPGRYPYEWFGAAVWDAYTIPENDYYLDDTPSARTPSLPQAEDIPFGGYISPGDVRRFIADGRQEVYKKALWYVISQYSLPEEERVPLVIRDVPQNVELWIAAIERAFSEKAAEKITFATNRSRIENNNTRNLYYFVRANGTVTQFKSSEEGLSRRVYNFLVGVHPSDSFARNLSTSGYFALLDGISLSISVDPDKTVSNRYYEDAASCGEDIDDFCGIVLPELGWHRIDQTLPRLYDAYCYLLNADNRNGCKSYPQTVMYLETLESAGLKNSRVFSDYIVTALARAYRVLRHEDVRERFALLNKLYRIAVRIGREQNLADVYRDYLTELLSNIGSRADEMALNEEALATFPQALSKAATKPLFTDALIKSCANQTPELDTRTAKSLLAVFENSLWANGVMLDDLPDCRLEFSFYCLCVLQMSDDKSLVQAHFKKIQHNKRLFYTLVVAVSAFFSKSGSDRFERWWELVIETADDSLSQLCQKLIDSGNASDELVEKILANRVRRREECDEELVLCFRDFLIGHGNEDTGCVFFLTWLDVVKDRELSRLIYEAGHIGISKHVQKTVFAAVDSLLPMDKRTRELEDLAEWGRCLGLTSIGLALMDFLSALKRAKNYRVAEAHCHQLVEAHLLYRSDLVSQDIFKRVCKEVDVFFYGNLHVNMMCLFVFGDREELERYLNAYIEMIVSVSNDKALTMLALTEAVTCRVYVPERSPEYVLMVQKTALNRIRLRFREFATRKNLKHIEKAEFGEDIKRRLMLLLN